MPSAPVSNKNDIIAWIYSTSSVVAKTVHGLRSTWESRTGDISCLLVTCVEFDEGL